MRSLNWSNKSSKTDGLIRRLLARYSLVVRNKQYSMFVRFIKPSKYMTVLDVGVTPNEGLVDSNFFEKRYPFLMQVTLASVEDLRPIHSLYRESTFKQLRPYSKLPYKKNNFDIVTSWATLEHTGTRQQQRMFLKECLRVGKRVFLTTPNKNFIFDFHTDWFFVHWLPNKVFSKICIILGKPFWGKIKNLNLLTKNDILDMIETGDRVDVIEFKLFKLFTTHFLIIKS